MKNCWALGTIENDLKKEEMDWRVVSLKLKLEVINPQRYRIRERTLIKLF